MMLTQANGAAQSINKDAVEDLAMNIRNINRAEQQLMSGPEGQKLKSFLNNLEQPNNIFRCAENNNTVKTNTNAVKMSNISEWHSLGLTNDWPTSEYEKLKTTIHEENIYGCSKRKADMLNLRT